MASKKRQIAQLEYDLHVETAKRAARDEEIRELKRAASSNTRIVGQLNSARLVAEEERDAAREALADAKAAWDHDQEQRQAAEKERDDLRRQLSKVREAHEKEHEALYPDLGKPKGVFGGSLIDIKPAIDTFPQWEKMAQGAERC